LRILLSLLEQNLRGLPKGAYTLRPKLLTRGQKRSSPLGSKYYNYRTPGGFTSKGKPSAFPREKTGGTLEKSRKQCTHKKKWRRGIRQIQPFLIPNPV